MQIIYVAKQILNKNALVQSLNALFYQSLKEKTKRIYTLLY